MFPMLSKKIKTSAWIDLYYCLLSFHLKTYSRPVALVIFFFLKKKEELIDVENSELILILLDLKACIWVRQFTLQHPFLRTYSLAN